MPFKQRLSYLSHPLVIAALLLLLLNDFLLKAIYPGALTGKLSDFAGVLLLATVIFVLSGKRWLGVALTIVSFTWWKLTWSQPFIDGWNAYTAFPISRVVDITDLSAFIALPLLYAIRLRKKQSIHRWREPALLTVISLALLASNSDDIRFMNAMSGETPTELHGIHVTLERSGKANVEYRFHQRGDGVYTIITGRRDTVFRGQIVRHEDIYFANRRHPLYPDDYFVIQAFRISNDSIWNFQSVFAKRPYALINTDQVARKRYFKDINTFWSEGNEQNIVLINNTVVETYEAFSELLLHTRVDKVSRP